MAIGLGLLTSQAKGELTGSKGIFSFDKDTSAKLSETGGKVKIVAENKDKHAEENIVADFELPYIGGNDNAASTNETSSSEEKKSPDYFKDQLMTGDDLSQQVDYTRPNPRR